MVQKKEALQSASNMVVVGCCLLLPFFGAAVSRAKKVKSWSGSFGSFVATMLVTGRVPNSIRPEDPVDPTGW